MVSKMLINRSHPQPATKKAPAGGKMMVTRMRITSEALTDIAVCVRDAEVLRSRVVLGLRGCCGAAEITAAPDISTWLPQLEVRSALFRRKRPC